MSSELSYSWNPSNYQAFFLVVLLTIAAAYRSYRRRLLKYPPGPPPLITIAKLLLGVENIIDLGAKCKKKFGQIYTVFIGKTPAVWLTEYDVIHEAFISNADDFSSRPKEMGAFFGKYADKGIISSPNWKEQRKFALVVLREQGMGKVDMEGKILEEAEAFMKEIDRNTSGPHDVDDDIHKAVSNVICNLVLGSRFEYSDQAFIDLLDSFLSQSKKQKTMRLLEAMPVLRKLPGDLFSMRKFIEGREKTVDYFTTAIRHHAQKLDVNDPKDFIDAYLIEMKKQSDNGSSSSFDELNCVTVVAQLFGAGTDTTSNALLWAWLYMILHPDVQRKVQAEIDQCIGSRPPSMKDKLQMPYTKAVLTEVMRIGNIAPASLPHKVDRDVFISGHTIPKDTRVYASIAGVHMDEKNYAHPHEFMPDRFLDSRGKFEKPQRYLPFGIGRRACPGESLARAELFLFFTSVLQRYRLESPVGAKLSTQGVLKVAYTPQNYSIEFTKRDMHQSAM